MSYQVLARKWRPKNFQELIGQEHVLQPLVNALTQQRLHHAYLFTGTRGVGKTTIARILARCLNCESGITATPCGACTACEDITQGRFVDLIEVDAASRTKVEDTRELLDNVQYAPTRGRFKIYLIDEVHMLSNHSFNALLKTLEEPPPHVKFLLATTDPQRLPVTILSRCLQFHLKNLAPELISAHLQRVVTKENLSAEPLALHALAKAADGSVRDALSLLDQAIAYCEGLLTAQQINTMLGTIDQQFLQELLEGLATRNGQQLLTSIARMVEINTDFASALESLLSLLHQIAVEQIVAHEQDVVIQHYAQQFSAADIQLFYQIGLIGRRDLPLAPSARVGFEMVLLRMLAFYIPSATPQKKTEPVIPPVSNQPIISPTHAVETVSTKPPKPIKVSPSNWVELVPQLGINGMVLALASHCVLEKYQENFFELKLAVKHKPLLNKKVLERLTQALQNHYKTPIRVVIQLADSEQLSPAELKQHAQDERYQQAKQNLEQDEHVKTIISVFNAKLVRTESLVG